MKKKVILYGIGGLLLVIVIAVVVAMLMLDGIVRDAVADSATQGLKVKTTVTAADVSPFGGNVALRELRVASPEGFSAPHVFTLGNVAVDVRYSQLFGQPVQVAKIRVEKPKLVIEQAGGKINVWQLIQNLDKPDAPQPDGDTEPVRLVIDQLDIEGAVVEIRPGIPGLNETITLNVPPISVANIGNAEGNRNGEEVGRVVGDIAQLLAQRAAEDERVPPAVRQLLKMDLGQIKDEAMQRVNTEIEQGKQKLDREIGKGLDKLLGGKKDEKAK